MQCLIEVLFIQNTDNDWRFLGSCTSVSPFSNPFGSDSLSEIRAMNHLMVGFKGTLPQYRDKVEAGSPQRKLVKQGPLVKFSRTVKSPRFFFLVCCRAVKGDSAIYIQCHSFQMF